MGASAQRDNIYFTKLEMKFAGRTPFSTSGLAMVAESQFVSRCNILRRLFFMWINNLRRDRQLCIKCQHGISVLTVLFGVPRFQLPWCVEPKHHGFRPGLCWPRMLQRNRGPRLDLLWPRDGQIKKNCLHFSICACHPCAGAMLIFSVSFQF